jgi:hypothetical protein
MGKEYCANCGRLPANRGLREYTVQTDLKLEDWWRSLHIFFWLRLTVTGGFPLEGKRWMKICTLQVWRDWGRLCLVPVAVRSTGAVPWRFPKQGSRVLLVVQ